MPGVSPTGGTTLPTGEDAFSAGEAQPEAIAAAEWRLPRRLAVIGTAGDRFGQNTLGAAARGPVGTVAAQVEYARVSSTGAGAKDVDQLRATAALRLTRDLQLDGWAGRVSQGWRAGRNALRPRLHPLLVTPGDVECGSAAYPGTREAAGAGDLFGRKTGANARNGGSANRGMRLSKIRTNPAPRKGLGPRKVLRCGDLY
jgi:hypothetical protein